MLAGDSTNPALSKHALIMFGVAAITLDAARAETTAIPETIEDETEQSIALSYAIRCCPAHDISQPVWKLRTPKYRRRYVIAAWAVDLTDLNGRAFALEHVGGPGILRHLATHLRGKGVIGPLT